MKIPQFAKLVLVSSIALALTACGSDDDDNNATPATSTVAPPTLGQHTLDVLRDVLGKSECEIAALQNRGVV